MTVFLENSPATQTHFSVGGQNYDLFPSYNNIPIYPFFNNKIGFGYIKRITSILLQPHPGFLMGFFGKCTSPNNKKKLFEVDFCLMRKNLNYSCPGRYQNDNNTVKKCNFSQQIQREVQHIHKVFSLVFVNIFAANKKFFTRAFCHILRCQNVSSWHVQYIYHHSMYKSFWQKSSLFKECRMSTFTCTLYVMHVRYVTKLMCI